MVDVARAIGLGDRSPNQVYEYLKRRYRKQSHKGEQGQVIMLIMRMTTNCSNVTAE
jgi:hypothetical protein